MDNEIVKLTYPSSLLKVPVINQLIKNFEITLNIIRAQIDTDQGWIEVQLSGNPLVIEEAMLWLRSQGVDVQIKNNNE